MIIPPIKSQGIKTKLVPWIIDVVRRSGVDLGSAGWIEPFFGTSVVGFNSPLQGRHIAGDTNPHIIQFYNKVKSGAITGYAVKQYLEDQGRLLKTADEEGYAYFREVRDRFNEHFDPLDFIFLSRAGFNGMMRFNRQGKWNVPFCKKPNRFAPAYVTKICNQVDNVAGVIKKNDWDFIHQTFSETIALAGEGDIIYCDPPYFGRYADYYNGWSEENEITLYKMLSNTNAKFILSTWHHNKFRENEMIPRLWSKFNVVTKDHFYHNGGSVKNRHSMTEALVFNFDLQESIVSEVAIKQLSLFEMGVKNQGMEEPVASHNTSSAYVAVEE